MRDCWIGMDESGKGDYFGPLVAAAVAVSPAEVEMLAAWGVRDSKRLSDNRARELALLIRGSCPFEVVAIGPQRYNELYEKMRNLNRLLGWAHARALENLLERVNCKRALADQFGDKQIIEQALMRRGKDILLEQRHKAEEDPAVAAASVVARAEFLERLERMSREFGKPLPKGASPLVESAARRLVQDHGADVLKRVAKLHFKTTQSVLAPH
jgi:ribonuclease HIII